MTRRRVYLCLGLFAVLMCHAVAALIEYPLAP